MKKTPTIYLICGFLGAGKTTYSKKLAKEKNAIHLNPDEVVMKRYSKEEYENNWEACFAETMDFLWQETASYIQQNKDIIFDVGFWDKASRVIAKEKATKLGATPIIYYIYAPDEILKQRISSRKGKIAEHNLLHFDDIKKYFEEPSDDETFITIKNY